MCPDSVELQFPRPFLDVLAAVPKQNDVRLRCKLHTGNGDFVEGQIQVVCKAEIVSVIVSSCHGSCSPIRLVNNQWMCSVYSVGCDDLTKTTVEHGAAGCPGGESQTTGQSDELAASTPSEQIEDATPGRRQHNQSPHRCNAERQVCKGRKPCQQKNKRERKAKKSIKLGAVPGLDITGSRHLFREASHLAERGGKRNYAIDDRHTKTTKEKLQPPRRRMSTRSQANLVGDNKSPQLMPKTRNTASDTVSSHLGSLTKDSVSRTIDDDDDDPLPEIKSETGTSQSLVVHEEYGLESSDNHKHVQDPRMLTDGAGYTGLKEKGGMVNVNPPWHGVCSQSITEKTFLQAPRDGVALSCLICGSSNRKSLHSLRKHVTDAHSVEWEGYRNLFELDFDTAVKKLTEMWTQAGQSRELDQHFKGTRPCPKCGKAFTLYKSLLRHVSHQHKDEPDFNTLCASLREEGVEQTLKGVDKVFQLEEPNAAKEEIPKRLVSLTVKEKPKSTKSHNCEICLAKYEFECSLIQHLNGAHRLRWRAYKNILRSSGTKTNRLEEIRTADKLRFAQSVQRAAPGQRSALMKCPICSRGFLVFRYVVQHVKTAHGDHPDKQKALLTLDKQFDVVYSSRGPPVCCPYCGKERRGRNSIVSHLTCCHSDEDDFQSKMRGMQKMLKELHLLSLRQENQKRVQQEKQLAAEGKARCRFCGKRFSYRSAMYRHEQFSCRSNPSKRQTMYCKICTKRFIDGAKFDAHTRSHEAEAPTVQQGGDILCHLCGRSFQKKAHLMRHRREFHCHGKKSVCPVCQKEFQYSSTYFKHIRTHEEPRHPCSACSKKFNTNDHLQTHYRTIHLGLYPFSCDKCGHGMLKQEYLKQHQCGRVRRRQSSKLISDPRQEVGMTGGTALNHVCAPIGCVESDPSLGEVGDGAKNQRPKSSGDVENAQERDEQAGGDDVLDQAGTSSRVVAENHVPLALKTIGDIYKQAEGSSQLADRVEDRSLGDVPGRSHPMDVSSSVPAPLSVEHTCQTQNPMTAMILSPNASQDAKMLSELSRDQNIATGAWNTASHPMIWHPTIGDEQTILSNTATLVNVIPPGNAEGGGSVAGPSGETCDNLLVGENSYVIELLPVDPDPNPLLRLCRGPADCEKQ